MKCVARAGRPSIHELGLAIAGASLLVAAAIFSADNPPFSLFVCPLRAATGIPCLTCGCTHAFAAVARLHLIDAVAASPLGAVAAAACAVHASWTALRLCGFPYAPVAPAATPRIRLCAAAALAANWLFLIVHGAP